MPKLSKTIRALVRERAGYRCEYCLSLQKRVFLPLEIDHIVPRSAGGTDDEVNLCLSCRMCNGAKQSHTTGLDPVTLEEVSLFNPRLQTWLQHFAWSSDGTTIIGQSPEGRATVIVLDMNNDVAVEVRQGWMSVGWHPAD